MKDLGPIYRLARRLQRPLTCLGPCQWLAPEQLLLGCGWACLFVDLLILFTAAVFPSQISWPNLVFAILAVASLVRGLGALPMVRSIRRTDQVVEPMGI